MCHTYVVVQAILSQDAAEALLEEASALGLSLGTTWEEDANQCEVRTPRFEGWDCRGWCLFREEIECATSRAA